MKPFFRFWYILLRYLSRKNEFLQYLWNRQETYRVRLHHHNLKNNKGLFLISVSFSCLFLDKNVPLWLVLLTIVTLCLNHSDLFLSLNCERSENINNRYTRIIKYIPFVSDSSFIGDHLIRYCRAGNLLIFLNRLIID